MKQIEFFIFFLASLTLPSICSANLTTQNAQGVTISYLDTDANSTAHQVLATAMSLEGVKYKYGGESPETGFDCSGFVNYVYGQAASMKLPRTAKGISRFGHSVNQDELAPGDLVFFNTSKRAFSHVGIYVGDGNFIHAPSRGGHVRIDSMHTSYWQPRYNGARRLDVGATD